MMPRCGSLREVARASTLVALCLGFAGCAAHRSGPLDSAPPFGRPSPADGGQIGDPYREPRDLFISPMGEPFRMPRPENAWFAGADADGDGRIVPAEFRADAARFFRVLDRAGDGEIDPEDIDVYENRLAPEIRVRDGGGPGGSAARADRGGGGSGRRGGPGGGGPGGGGLGGGQGRGGTGMQGGDRSSAPVRRAASAQGAARYGYLDLPEPVTSADRNFNRGVDAGEFARAADERFALLDRNHDAAITAGDLPAIDTRLHGDRFGGAPGFREGGPFGGERLGGRPAGADEDEDGQ